MKKYEQLATEIIRNVGGERNVISLEHCITRLRFKLKDERKADTEALKELDGVVTVIKSAGQYQVVIGNAVGDVYDAVLEVSDISAADGSIAADDVGRKMNMLDSFIDTVSGIFTPILGVLAASGMVKGFLALFVAMGLVEAKGGTWQVVNIVSDAFFYFLPIFLACTAARKFKMSEFSAMAIGAALVYPSLSVLMKGEALYQLFSGTIIASNVKLEFFGIPVILMNYASSVIPIILAIYFGAKVERTFAKIIPMMIKGFMVPFCTLLVMIPMTLMVVGPIATWAGQLIGAGVTMVYSLSPVIAGAVIGGFWQVFVMFGLHWGLVPIMLHNVASMGFDPVIVTYFGATFAQIGVVLGILLRTKDKKLKALAIPAFFSGIFGVTEPAIYGVTLPRKKYFIFSCIGAAAGGSIMAFFGVKLFIFGGLGIFGYPCFIDPATNDVSGMYYGILASAVSFVVGLVLTLPVFKDEVIDGKGTSGTVQARQEFLSSPLSGKTVAMENIPDEAFSSGVLGKGLAIEPSEGRLLAPADGMISTVFPTGHAIGLITDAGTEILIHIGMDTVQMEGSGFKIHVAQGSRVKKGQLLIEFDIKAIQAAGHPIITPVLVTNTADYLDVVPTSKQNIESGDLLLTAISQN